jgi:uncharacterized protein with von Willebrand factor type A (vWA) domain
MSFFPVFVFSLIIILILSLLFNNSTEQALVFPATLTPEETVVSVERRTSKNYYVVFDGSGSMLEYKCSGNENKIDVAKRAVQEFASTIPKDANLGLVVFDYSGLSERLALGQDNQNNFVNEIQKVSPDGGTPLRSAIFLAANQLAKQAAFQMGYGEYHLVVVTDGEANSDEDPRFIVGSILKDSPIVLHTVGFCIGADHSLNQEGQVIYQSADNPDELRQGLKDVMAEATTFNIDEFSKSE